MYDIDDDDDDDDDDVYVIVMKFSVRIPIEHQCNPSLCGYFIHVTIPGHS